MICSVAPFCPISILSNGTLTLLWGVGVVLLARSMGIRLLDNFETRLEGGTRGRYGRLHCLSWKEDRDDHVHQRLGSR